MNTPTKEVLPAPRQEIAPAEIVGPSSVLQMIERAASESRDYAARLSAPKPADPVVRYGHQVGWLERDIKTLCQEVAYYQAKCSELQAASRAQGERIAQLQFDAAKGDDEFEQQADELSQRIAAFNRSTGAAEALRGGL